MGIILVPRVIPKVKISPASNEKNAVTHKNEASGSSSSTSQFLAVPNNDSGGHIPAFHQINRRGPIDTYGTTTILVNPLHKKSASDITKRQPEGVKFTKCCPLLKLLKRNY